MLMLDAWLVLPKLVRCGPLFLSSYLSKLLIPFLCLSKHHWCCLSLLLPSLFIMPSLAPPQWSPPPIFLLSLSNIAPCSTISSLGFLLSSPGHHFLPFWLLCLLQAVYLKIDIWDPQIRENNQHLFLQWSVISLVKYFLCHSLTSKFHRFSFLYRCLESTFLYFLKLKMDFLVQYILIMVPLPKLLSDSTHQLKSTPFVSLLLENRHLTEQQKCNKIK